MARMGFIQDKLEIKFLLLYIASRLIEPVPFEAMQELAMIDDGVDFFDFSECMNDLVTSGHLTLSEDGLYAITEKGLRVVRETTQTFDRFDQSMFEGVSQRGAILGGVVLFWSQIWPFGRKNNVAPLTKRGPGAWIKTDIFKLWFHILVSTIPAAVIGVLADDWVEEHFYNYQMVSVMLILFGIAFILIENSHKGKNSRINSLADIGYDTALFIGLFQLIAAIFPGTSRSGATIVGALLIGVSRTVAAEYTFFLAIPVMFGASILKIAKFGLDFSTSEVVILFVGCVIAFAVSLIVIRFLMGYIKKHDFKVFGYYRIILGVFVLACGFLRALHA